VNYVAYAFCREIFHNFGQIQRGRLRRSGAGATGDQDDQRRDDGRGKPSPGARMGAGMAEDW
jgi:hypothetical protein